MLECNSSVICAVFSSALHSWLRVGSRFPQGPGGQSTLPNGVHGINFDCPYVRVTCPASPLPVHRFKEDALVDMDCDDAEDAGELGGFVQDELDRFHAKKLAKDGEQGNVLQHSAPDNKRQWQNIDEKTIRDLSHFDHERRKNNDESVTTDSSFSSTLNTLFPSSSQSFADRRGSFSSDASSILKSLDSSRSGAGRSPVLVSSDSSSRKHVNQNDRATSAALSAFSISSARISSAYPSSLSPSEFSRLWLQSTLQRLQLPPVPAEAVPLTSFSPAILQAEKKKLKSELRNFDAEFSRTFGREITREDKESIRCLYAYYQKVKKHVNRLHQAKPVEQSQTTVNMPVNHIKNPRNCVFLGSSAGVSSFPQSACSVSPPSVASQASSPFCLSAPVLSKPASTSTDSDNAASGSPYSPASSFAKHSSRSLLQIVPFSAAASSTSIFHPTRSVSDSPSKSGQTRYLSLPSNSSIAYGNEFIEELMRLQRLRDAKRALRERLVAYQSKFREANGRPVKLYKDIAPIEREYSQYKKLKEEINACMEKMGITNDKSEAKNKIKEALGLMSNK